jgi:ribonuclease-3
MTKAQQNSAENWQQLELALGYSFRDRAQLVKAMTHGSYANEAAEKIADNERLEFLGDAVLDLVISEYLMGEFPGQDEGVLTQTRADVVAMPSLAELAKTLGVGAGLLLGKGEERTGGRDKPNLLADALEAIFGAVFIDGGYDAAKSVILPLFVPLLKEGSMESCQDYKSRLQEVLQARQQPLPAYKMVKADGPDHERVYSVEVQLNGIAYGLGEGRSKKNAEQAAAKATLKKLDSRQ